MKKGPASTAMLAMSQPRLWAAARPIVLCVWGTQDIDKPRRLARSSRYILVLSGGYLKFPGVYTFG
jgi:hypothetical protein